MKRQSLENGEDEELEQHYRRMLDGKKITEGITEAYQYTSENGAGNASDYLSRAIRALQEAADCDEQGAALYEQLTEIDSLLNDFNRELSDYAKSFEFSEEEFYETETRLNELNRLKSKYGNTVSEILAYCEKKKQRLKELEDYENYMLESARTIGEGRKKLSIPVRRNSAKQRTKSGDRILWKKSKKGLSDLNFLDVSLRCGSTELESLQQAERTMQSFICPPIREKRSADGTAASGGELSRIMLVIKTFGGSGRYADADLR